MLNKRTQIEDKVVLSSKRKINLPQSLERHAAGKTWKMPTVDVSTRGQVELVVRQITVPSGRRI